MQNLGKERTKGISTLAKAALVVFPAAIAGATFPSATELGF